MPTVITQHLVQPALQVAVTEEMSAAAQRLAALVAGVMVMDSRAARPAQQGKEVMAAMVNQMKKHTDQVAVVAALVEMVGMPAQTGATVVQVVN